MSQNETPSLKFMNVRISNATYSDVYKKISSAVRKKERGYVVVTDVGNVVAASKDEKLRQAINGALFSVADGTPLGWYARMAGCRRIERVSGMDLMVGLMTQMNCKHLLLGDTVRTLNRVVAKAREINPGIDIVGYSPPFKDFSQEDNDKILRIIDQTDADLIWVSFGGGKQEKWMKQNVGKLKKGVMIGVGAAFRWFTGDIRPPPLIFQKLGLQWLFRVFQGIVKDPRSGFQFLVERQLKKFPVFIANFPFELMKYRKSMRYKTRF